MTLVEFLRARLDEDEAAARAATPGPWSVDDEGYAETIYGRDDSVAVVAGGRWGGEASVFESTADALHIARHDPARVLAEVGAKRRIVDECSYWYDKVEGGQDYPALADRFEVAMSTLRLLALPHADHPDYDETWRP